MIDIRNSEGEFFIGATGNKEFLIAARRG